MIDLDGVAAGDAAPLQAEVARALSEAVELACHN
jgi:hypothetical protein